MKGLKILIIGGLLALLAITSEGYQHDVDVGQTLTVNRIDEPETLLFALMPYGIEVPSISYFELFVPKTIGKVTEPPNGGYLGFYINKTC